jgi:parallel beta-helix repeat protein
VFSASSSSENLVFERLNVSANYIGIVLNGYAVVRVCNCQNNTSDGIDCYGGGIISGCTVNNNGGYGISCNFGNISGCTVNDNAGVGIDAYDCAVSGCTVENNSNSGIEASYGTVSGCTSQNNAYWGIYIVPGIVSGCLVENNEHSGIYVNANGCTVTGNTCIGNNTAASTSDAGIYTDDSYARIEDNNVSSSGYAGIQLNVVGSDNVIIKNSVSGNGANNYVVPGTQIVGPLITTTGTISSANPWANFSF